VTEHQPPEVGRWVGLGDALKRFVLSAVAAAVALGALAALVAVATGHTVSGTMAAAYYIVGAALFLIGMFPTGGFSVFRGTITRRRPTGSRQEPVFLLGLVLVALGVIADVVRPF
jgi:hypothetical protein